MSNVFFSGFHNYIVKASNPYEGRFYESNGTLIYELKKICLEWDVIGQVRFPEHQCVQIVFKYAQINKIINNEIICCLLNHLNCDEDAFGWFYLKDGYLYSKTVLLPDNENYSIENVMNIINFYLGYTINLYDLLTGIEKDLIRRMEESSVATQSDEKSGGYSDIDEPQEEFYDDYEDCSERWDIDDLADYYGYQYNEDYSASQFIDNL